MTCDRHPRAARYQRHDGYTGCRDCQNERRRTYRARNRRPAQPSTPNKLTDLDRALIYAAVDIGHHTRRDIADRFGISETRLYQLLRERQEATT